MCCSRNGIARAFENPRLVDAISAVPGGIAVLVLEWSGPDQIEVTVGGSGSVTSTAPPPSPPRSAAPSEASNGLTAIGPRAAGRRFCIRQPAGAGGPADHRYFRRWDANFGLPPKAARDRIVAAGISINGLAILTGSRGSKAIIAATVIGGPGAFVVVSQDFGSFAEQC